VNIAAEWQNDRSKNANLWHENRQQMAKFENQYILEFVHNSEYE